MPPENPERLQAPEAPAQAPAEQPYITRSDEIWRTLQFTLEQGARMESTLQEWKTLLQRVASDIPNPADARVTPVEQERLVARYKKIDAARHTLVRALLLLIAKLDQRPPQPPSPALQVSVKRYMAQYLTARDDYDRMWANQDPVGVRLPVYLREFVELDTNEEYASKVALSLLPLQYDVARGAGIKESPIHLADYGNEIVISAVRRRLEMKYVLSCINPDGSLKAESAPFEVFLQAAGFDSWSPEDLSATKLFIGLLAKNMDSVRRYAETSPAVDNLEALTVADALKSMSHLVAISEVTEEVAEQGRNFFADRTLPDITQVVGRVFSRRDMFSEETKLSALRGVSNLAPGATKEEKQQFQNDAKVVAEFFLNPINERIAVKNISRHYQNLNIAQKKMIDDMVLRVQQPETIDRLLTASLIPKEASGIEKEAADALRQIIQSGDLHIREAFDLYTVSESGGFDIALAYKVIHILKNHNKETLATNFQTRLLRKFYDMATSKMLSSEISIPGVELTEPQERELENMRQYLSERGGDAIGRFWDQYWALMREWPEWMIPLTGGAVAGMLAPPTIWGYKLFVKVRMAGLSKFAAMNDAELLQKYGAEKFEQAKLVHARVRNLVTNLQLTQLRLRPFLGKQIRAEAVVTMRLADATELADVAKGLKNSYPRAQDMATALDRLAENDQDLRSALKAAGYPEQEVNAAMDALVQSRAVAERTSAAESRVSELESQGRTASARLLKLEQELLRLQQADGGTTDLRTALADIAAVRLTPEQRLAKLQELRTAGNVDFADISRIENAIRSGQEVDFVVETTVAGPNGSPGRPRVDIKIK